VTSSANSATPQATSIDSDVERSSICVRARRQELQFDGMLRVSRCYSHYTAPSLATAHPKSTCRSQRFGPALARWRATSSGHVSEMAALDERVWMGKPSARCCFSFCVVGGHWVAFRVLCQLSARSRLTRLVRPHLDSRAELWPVIGVVGSWMVGIATVLEPEWRARVARC